MLKKVLAVGAVVAGFSGLVLAGPAQAGGRDPWPSNTNQTNSSVIGDSANVCGNSLIDYVAVNVLTLSPSTGNSDKDTDCGNKVTQNNDND
ncbi:multisubunit Na+/H+ antiporter MnhB subunit [Thermocatellispora tengchongensis]|uniref:Multisubunit Na+/H+ antiporter MnhB subunit n=1 Tax=Thermocatellispora tengchongensis TaxID=1073253 RepID=A0A840PNW5_9ACTN|nr:hypothetical protein [Thermocatellispora tengchongensis]MBB5139390.1 multisubunit Na+/H+ antiporter MnhB subunit [Thermocatellispora tengchongensis]